MVEVKVAVCAKSGGFMSHNAEKLPESGRVLEKWDAGGRIDDKRKGTGLPATDTTAEGVDYDSLIRGLIPLIGR